jgi:polyphosphate glucokinase
MADQTVLAVDVGGSHVKALISTDDSEPRRFESGPKLEAREMVDGVVGITADWAYDLGPGWVGFDYEGAFGKPTKVVNDAAMQALGDYDGGKMLFLGLGTGLGSALIVDGILEPMELGHLPFRKATFEDYVGARGRERLGKKKWRAAVLETVERLSAALEPDYVVLGGGDAKRLDELPENTRLGANRSAFLGGFRLWDPPMHG